MRARTASLRPLTSCQRLCPCGKTQSLYVSFHRSGLPHFVEEFRNRAPRLLFNLRSQHVTDWDRVVMDPSPQRNLKFNVGKTLRIPFFLSQIIFSSYPIGGLVKADGLLLLNRPPLLSVCVCVQGIQTSLSCQCSQAGLREPESPRIS